MSDIPDIVQFLLDLLSNLSVVIEWIKKLIDFLS